MMKNLGPKEIICSSNFYFLGGNDIYSPKLRVLDFYTKQPK